MALDGERRRLVEGVFAAALEREGTARAMFLSEQARSDPALAAEVRSLLDHHAAAARMLATPEAVAPPRPERIGAYRILDVLGQGGMGVVYLAEQDHPRRSVALKVIRPSFATPDALQRFAHEAQLLARLKHAGIAQIYEAGTADSGLGPQPYFAMEYVPGEPLAEFVRRRSPALRERLELLIQVADAVEHAHRRGVIHRDLKPSNVLVDDSGGRPLAKVLDFGVARAIEDDERATALRTGVGQMIGTLPYMSPEQSSGDPDALDLRSDVYALGVIGYELLSGRRPLELTDVALPEALRVLNEVEPAPLSRLDARLRGDLSTIFAKALEKDRERRYATARDLGDDLRRFLEHQPISARPPSTVYVVTKFARRHRVLVGAAAAVALALTLGLIGTLRQSIRAEEQRMRADREARRVRGVAEFQRAMLAEVRPDRSGRDVRLADVLDSAAAKLPGELAGDPAVEGGVREMLGESFDALGLPSEAETQFRAALALYESAFGATSLEAARVRNWLSSALYDLGRVDEARAELRTLIDGLREAYGDDHPRLLDAELRLAHCENYSGRPVEAEQLARSVLARAADDGDENSIDARSAIGTFLLQQGRPADAEPFLREAYERSVAVLGAEQRSTLVRLNQLAGVARDLGQLEQAETYYGSLVEIGSRRLGPDHFETLTWVNNLAAVYERTQRYEQAEPLYRRVLDVRLARLGEEHKDTLIVMNNLGLLLLDQKRYDDAEPLLQQSLAVKQRVFGPEHRETLVPRFNLGLLNILREEHERALPYLREAAELAARVLEPGHWRIGQYTEGYGAALMHLRRLDEAEPVLLQALEQLRTSLPATDARVTAVAERLFDLYRERGEPLRADELRAQLGMTVG